MNQSPIEKVHLCGFEFFVKRDDEISLLDALNLGFESENLALNLSRNFSGNLCENAANFGLNSCKNLPLKNAANLSLNLRENLSLRENFGDLFSCEFLAKIQQILSGNKARKLEFFIKNPQIFTPNSRLISFGSAQSNAMAALSVFAWARKREFIYVCEKIPAFLKENPCGNYEIALKFGAKIIENLDCKSRKIKALSLFKKDDIFINEGIAQSEVELGFKGLASEIIAQSKDLQCEFDIFLPSGTGASAFYLAKNLPNTVFTCACVGDEGYLLSQMADYEDAKCENHCVNFTPNSSQIRLNLTQNSCLSENFILNSTQNSRLNSQPNPVNFAPQSTLLKNLFILKTPRKFHFAKPYKELLQLWQRAKSETGIEFSLIYDSVGLCAVLENRALFKKPLLYIHQGGTFGNESMLKRYEFRRLV